MIRRNVLAFVLVLAAADAAADAVAVAALPGGAPASSEALSEEWRPVREVSGVPVEARPTKTGFDVHRGRVEVCTDMSSLEHFVIDPSRFTDWVAYTRSARLLDVRDGSAIYYVRSTTPWPLKDRDMIYRISRIDSNSSIGGLRLSLTGLPDYAPTEENAERIRAAAGEWQLVPSASAIDVSYELYLDPGRVPRFLANQRLAAAVGQTLANLAAHFPCAES